MFRRIFIGDVHGCLTELQSLMGKLEPSAKDSVVFLGDLIDKGYDPVGVVRYVRSNGWTSILGNHDERAVRWHKHVSRQTMDPKYRNPMRPDEELAAEWNGLNAEDVAFLNAMPPYLRVSGVGSKDWLAVHGGLLPGIRLEQQKVSEIIRCRWIDSGGKHQGMVGGSPEMPAGARPWMDAFDGGYNAFDPGYHVVCGHAVHSLETPRVDRAENGFEVWSIDTGCVFGGRLTALVLDPARPDDREVVQVQARRKYADQLTMVGE
jgi:hypothetical protein